MTARRIALAAGGTGGHVFPAVALGEALARRGHRVLVLTDARGGAFETADAPWTVRRVRAASPNRPGLGAKLSAVARLGLGLLDARRALREWGADAAVGFGGYASVPAALAAASLGLPVVLHEQNAVLGRANRWLAGRAKAVALSLEPTAGLEGRAAAISYTGNPVRAAILERRGAPWREPAPGEPVELLVFGGSLGARALSDTVPAAVAALAPDLRDRLRAVQQCRPEDVERVRAAWRGLARPAEVRSFLDDMPDRLAAAHLAIARAGASTVAELATVGRPAILVPYPHAMDDHQSRNAAVLEAAGAAWVLPEASLSPEVLARLLDALLRDPARLAAAAAAARALGRPDAAERLADLVLRAAAEREGARRPGGARRGGDSRPVERRRLA